MSAATTTPGSAPKSMSSRLLTMKFMQRAANSSPATTSPSSPDEPSLKRRRVESEASPTTKRGVGSLADRAAIQAAIAKEEAKRQVALDKQAADAGDTRWVLSFEDQDHSMTPALSLRIVQTGYANLDASPSRLRIEEAEDEDKAAMVGRRSFGRFNKVLEKQQNPAFEDSSESDSEDDDENSEESDDDNDDPAQELIRESRREVAEQAKADRRAKKRAAVEELEQIAKRRRKQDVNLNGLTSLSGKPPPLPAGFKCHTCGGPHRKSDCPEKADRPENVIKCYGCGGPHLRRDCPEQKRGYQGGDDGPQRKAKRQY